MTDIRDSQVVAKALATNPADIRDSQVVAKALATNPADIRDSQVVAKALATSPADIRDSQVVAKALATNPADIRDSQSLVKVLHSTATSDTAGEVTLDVSLQMDNGHDALVFLPGEVRFNQTIQGHLDLTVSVTTTEQAVAFSGIANAGQVVIQNLDENTANYVRYGMAAGSYIGRIYGAQERRSGTADKLSWDPGASLYVVGNVSQKIRVIVCEA